MEMNCNDARPLIGAYVDGELSEVRATLLRKHLLECHTCRNSTQDGKTLKRWFAPLREAADDPTSEFSIGAPSGFAARVARRAFAGDTGEREVTLTPARANEARILPFVLRLTAVAAALALLLAIGFRKQSRPDGGNLSADDRTLLSVPQIQQELDQLNRGLAESARPPEAGDRPDANPRGAGRKRAKD